MIDRADMINYNGSTTVFATMTHIGNNTNPNFYCQATVGDDTYNIYNSAAYFDQNNNVLYVLIFGQEDGTYSNRKWGIAAIPSHSWINAYDLITYNSNLHILCGEIKLWNDLNILYSARITNVYEIGESVIPLFTDKNEYMNYITQMRTYTWQSVPSISGKNGILSLVTLDSESINDGEPVSGAAVSVFDQAPSNDNNIKNLADTYGGGEESSAVDVTVKYKVTLPPGGLFNTLKIVAKKDSMPENASDGDKIVDISPSKTKKTVTGLDENSLYYFKIFAEDTNSNTSESDEKHIMTSSDEGWSFDYTGSIQTFTAPKTGIYQLETWGAQGGNASDGTNSARGGYGAYAVGEVLLQQGDTLYINVGGQNGYGGGGNYVPYDPVPEEYSYIKKINDFYTKDYSYSSSGVIANFFEVQNYYNGGKSNPLVPADDLDKFTFMVGAYDESLDIHTESSSTPIEFYIKVSNSIMNIEVTTGNTVSVEYNNETDITSKVFFSNTGYLNNLVTKWNYLSAINGVTYNAYMVGDVSGGLNYYQSTFSTLDEALRYICKHYVNVNVYVDDVLWVSALT